MSLTYYTITLENLRLKLLLDKLIIEVLRRINERNTPEWNFTFDDLQVEILKKFEYKVDFFVSRDIPIGEGLHYLFQCSSNS